MDRTVFLMYHELELPGRPLCQTDPGYVRYVLPVSDFRSQMERMKDRGFRGISVGQAVEFPLGQCVAITFDDGTETDLIAAAPILNAAGFQATFFVTSGFLGRKGFLTPAQLRDLSALGFEIGCHSRTHAYLPDLNAEELEREIAGAKADLEQIVGKPVDHFSCPGGRYDHRALEVARRAGFRSVCTSRAQSNSSASSLFELGRVAVLRDLPPDSFERICADRGLWRLRFSAMALATVKGLLGNQNYDRIRARLLHKRG